MERIAELFTPKNIIYLLLAALIVLWAGVGKIENSLLQFFKPTSIQIADYTIDLHKNHWSYLREDERAYYALGKDGIVTLEVLKDAQDKRVKDEFLQCYENKTEYKKYHDTQGELIVCELPLKLIFYFKSSHGDLLIRSELNEPMNEHFMGEYLNFLEGIKKR